MLPYELTAWCLAVILSVCPAQEPRPRLQDVMLPCSGEDSSLSLEVLFPKDGSTLDAATDLTLLNSVVVHVRVVSPRNKSLKALSYAVKFAVTSRGLRDDDELDDYSVEVAKQERFEIFGIQEGKWFLQFRLIDGDGNSRDCWDSPQIRFKVLARERSRASQRERIVRALHRNAEYSRAHIGDARPFLQQPEELENFAYVTALWNNAYIDNVMAWASSLKATGSVFQRYCMVMEGEGAIYAEYHAVLEKCCCKLVGVQRVSTEAKVARYGLVLTKLRVLQLYTLGLRKVVFMDADMLVLENIDELFWFPAPAATVERNTLLAHIRDPYVSAGLMVLEPSEAEFQTVMKRYAHHGDRAIWTIPDQDLLTQHWMQDGRLNFHVLPLSYNLFPELLDNLPFLSPRSPGKNLDGSLVLPNRGVKVVHLRDWFNPIRATGSVLSLQVAARRAHPQLWEWYMTWWVMHERAMRDGMDAKLLQKAREFCRQSQRHLGPNISRNVVPMLGGGDGLICRHKVGILW